MRLFLLLVTLPLAAQFDYDRARIAEARHEPLDERSDARLWGGSFPGPSGGRVNYVLVEPKRRGRHPGMLCQHGGGQSMSNYLSEAALLAVLGVTSLIVDAAGTGTIPSKREMADIVVTQRMALDLLIGWTGVDPKRIGYVGHSYGGWAGGVLSGIEPRITAYVLLGAVPSMSRHIRESPSGYWAPLRARPDQEEILGSIAELDAERFLPKATAPILVQCAKFDTPDNLRACPLVHAAAGGPKELRWYPDDHNFTSLDALRDRVYWFEKQFGLKGARKALERWARKQ